MTTENISIEICEISTSSVGTSDFGFTRYLYIIDDVKSSLVIAILDRKLDEALFWAYELYFSGFKEDVFCILEQMLDMMYIPLNPTLGPFLAKKKQEWDDTGAYCIVGTFIYNMVYRSYDVSQFVKKYCKDPDLIAYIDAQTITKSAPGSRLKRNLHITVQPKDVVQLILVRTLVVLWRLRQCGRCNALKLKFRGNNHLRPSCRMSIRGEPNCQFTPNPVDSNLIDIWRPRTLT